MSRTVSKAELEKLQKEGAVVRTLKQAPKKAEPKPDTSIMDALERLTTTMTAGQKELAEKFVEAMQAKAEDPTKPLRHRFIIERDRRGLITGGEIFEIMEDRE